MADTERDGKLQSDPRKQRQKEGNKDTKKDVEEDDRKVMDKHWHNFISLSATACLDFRIPK